MDKNIKVFKFGGASLKDAAAIKNLTSILKASKDENILIVVSAMGKTTNALEAVLAAYFKKDEKAIELLDAVKNEHYALCMELFGENHEVFIALNDAFVEIEWVLEEEPEDSYDFTYDQIVSVGEVLCSHIIFYFLQKEGFQTQWLDARDVVITDNTYRDGRILWPETQKRSDRVIKPMLEKGGFVITQGFIGNTTENFSTTLGREGSDYSAAIFSYCLDAESMTIWKDVPGVLTADPRLFENVSKLDRMSYREAIEMTYYGAKVIHPKTIKPLQNKMIPLYVKSFLDTKESGTFISEETEDIYPPLVAVETEQAMIQLATKDFSFIAEHHLSHIFSLLAKLHLKVNLMQNTAISFILCVNDVDGKVDRFIAETEEQFKAVVNRELELTTVRHYNKAILKSLKEDKIVFIEERTKKTAQIVMKKVPMIMRK